MARTLIELIRRFAEIALGRRGPQDLPDSAFLLRLTAVGYALFVAAAFAGRPAAFVAAQVLLEMALLFAWVWVVLAARRRAPRMRRTLTALFGTGMLLTWMYLLLRLLLQLLGPDSGLAVLPLLGLFLLAVWLTVVNAHIMRHALDTTMVVGVVLALAYTGVEFAASRLVMGWFGEAA